MSSVLYLLLLAGALGYAAFLRRALRLRADVQRVLSAENRELARALESAQAKWSGMRPVADAEAHARTLRQEAETYAARLQLETQRECAALRQSVSAYLREADETLADADRRAQKLLESAQQRAESIAGEALRAKREAARLQTTWQALHNSIEGYGELYLVPQRTALDQWSEDAGALEAAQRLKQARERTRALVQSHGAIESAATDADSEALRATRALALDAFNGRAEAILACVGQEHGGTLEQRLRDAAALVEKSAAVLGDLRVQPAYLDARLEELRWAVALHQTKLHEQREQRALREQIRAEECAQAALTAAQGEVEALSRAAEELRRSAQGVSSAERARAQAQLSELNARLAAARERSARARALAEEPKAGTVYIVSNVGSFGSDVFKLGVTRQLDPKDAIRALNDASVPFPFDVHALIPSRDALGLAKQLARQLAPFQLNRLDPHKAFYRASLPQLEGALSALGVQVRDWSQRPAAWEYRESVALAEQALDASWLAAQRAAEPAPRSERVRVPTAPYPAARSA